MSAQPNIYTIGGTVQAGHGIYIPRRADDELLALCRDGAFAYILTARQMGKSSLMQRTAERLADQGAAVAIVDLNQLGTQLSVEEWYFGLAVAIGDSLSLSTDALDWWEAQTHLGVTQRLYRFFEDVVLHEIAAPVVVFIDEIDTTLSLEFTDDFFAAIRALYNARAGNHDLHRLSFVLIGVATPSDLIRDPKRTPFNLGQRVELSDFTFDEALPLADGLELPVEQAHDVLRWALGWTGGHPYLTQRLCRALLEAERDAWTKVAVDEVVRATFFGEQSEKDNNLQFVRDTLIERAPNRAAVLATYRDVRRGRIVRDDEQSQVKAQLKLSGVVRREGSVLRVRNPIYEHVFDLPWVKAHWPLSWWAGVPRGIKIAAGLVAVLVVALALLTSLLFGALDTSEQRRVAAETAQAQAAGAQHAAEASQREIAQRLRVSQSQALAFGALTTLDSDPEQGLLVAIEAVKLDKNLITDDALRQALAASHIRQHLSGHQGSVENVGWSPDGKRLMSGGADGTLRVWDAASGTPEVVLETGQGDVLSVGWSPDGKQLVSGGYDGTVRVWDAVSGTPGAVLRGHQGGVWSIGWSPDGKQLVSGGLDGTVRVWNASGAAGAVLRGHQGVVRSVEWSPDGKQLVSGGLDSTVRVWDASGAAGAVLRGHQGAITSVGWSPDGKQLVSGGEDGTVRVWDAASGTPGIVLRGHQGYVWSVEWSPDGKQLVSAGQDGLVRVWDAASGAGLRVLRGHTGAVASVQYSPDGKWIASAGEDGTISIDYARTEDLLAFAQTRVTRQLTDTERQGFGLSPSTSTP